MLESTVFDTSFIRIWRPDLSSDDAGK